MQSVYTLPTPIEIFAHASAVGYAEFIGPLGKYFDFHHEKDTFGSDTWEKAESELSHAALSLALNKAKLSHKDVSFLFSGDLQNQIVASSYAHVEMGIPFFGLYGACSTCTEGLLLSALTLNALDTPLISATVTSSHNSAAERQFRTPLEYGGQRTPTAQWTTTASGAFLLRPKSPLTNHPVIVKVVPGIIVDGGISDANNMGAAMAPAAAHSIYTFLSQTHTTPSDYDAIVTGDLGWEGSSLLAILLGEKGITLGDRHLDCGKLIYDPVTSDCHSGGSGCGCSAAVLSAYILPKLEQGEYRRVLFLSTGALMSPSSLQQGGNILGIAPVIELLSPKEAL